MFNSTETLYNKTIRSQFLQEFNNEELKDLILYGYEKIIKTYLQHRSSIPKDQLYEIAYQDLLEEPIDSIEKIYKTLSLGDFESVRLEMKQYLKSISDYKVNPPKPIAESTRKEINERWAFAFEEFGYSIQTS